MLDSEWAQIKYFSKNEVIEAGGDPAGMDFVFMRKLDRVRAILGRRIKLIYNGLNSGNHKAILHKNGKAADWYLPIEDGTIDVLTVLYAVLSSGLRGFGVYWNGVAFSFHTDNRKRIAFWKADKRGKQPWTYAKFLENTNFIKENQQ